MTEEQRYAKRLEYCRLWRQRNPEYMKAYYYRHRTKLRQNKVAALAVDKAKAALETRLQEMENQLVRLRQKLGGT
jgi:hypothetical protein